MSYFSDVEYKQKDGPEALWFERVYFERWFGGIEAPILDIGCATGNFIALDPESIEGVDIDDDSLKVAEKRGFRVKKLDAEKELSTLRQGTYNGVYAKHVIEHLERPLDFLKGIHSLLASGGKAVISTPNCPYMLTRGFFDDYSHIHAFTRKSLNMIAHDAGFSSVKVSEDFRCFPGLGRLMRIFRISPDVVRKLQSVFGLRGLSLIMELTK